MNSPVRFSWMSRNKTADDSIDCEDFFEYNDQNKKFLLNLYLKEKLTTLIEDRRRDREQTNALAVEATVGFLNLQVGQGKSLFTSLLNANLPYEKGREFANHPPAILSNSKNLKSYREVALENRYTYNNKIHRTVCKLSAGPQVPLQNNKYIDYVNEHMADYVKKNHLEEHFEDSDLIRFQTQDPAQWRSLLGGRPLAVQKRKSTKKISEGANPIFVSVTAKKKESESLAALRERNPEAAYALENLNELEIHLSRCLKQLLRLIRPKLSRNLKATMVTKYDEFFTMSTSKHYMIKHRELTYKVLLRGYWKLAVSKGATPDAREGSSFVLGTDKQAYFFGGLSTSRKNDLKVYNFETCVWTDIHPSGQAPSQRYGQTCILYDGKLYFFAGAGEYNHEKWKLDCLQDIKIFDYNEERWIVSPVRGSIPPRRMNHASVLLDKHMVTYGGSSGKPFGCLNDCFVLQLDTLNWICPHVIRKSNPGRLSGHSMVTYINPGISSAYLHDLWRMTSSRYNYEFGNRKLPYGVLMFGGVDEGNFYNNHLYLLKPGVRGRLETASYTVEIEQLATRGHAPFPRAYHSAVIFQEYMIIYGGRNDKVYSKNYPTLALDDLCVLNIPKMQWETIALYGLHPLDRYSHCMLVNDNQIYLIGGVTANRYCKPELYKLDFDPSSTDNFLNEKRSQLQRVAKEEQRCKALYGRFIGMLTSYLKRHGRRGTELEFEEALQGLLEKVPNVARTKEDLRFPEQLTEADERSESDEEDLARADLQDILRKTGRGASTSEK